MRQRGRAWDLVSNQETLSSCVSSQLMSMKHAQDQTPVAMSDKDTIRKHGNTLVGPSRTVSLALALRYLWCIIEARIGRAQDGAEYLPC